MERFRGDMVERWLLKNNNNTLQYTQSVFEKIVGFGYE